MYTRFLCILLFFIGFCLTACKDDLNCPQPPDCICADDYLFTDPRDSTVYRVVRLVGQDWMAENLNYAMANSWHYENDPLIGSVYGRLYTWEAALDACPEGWRLPDNEDWGRFFYYYPSNTEAYAELTVGGSSSFEALAGGGREPGGEFNWLGEIGGYWSITEMDPQNAYAFDFNSNEQKMGVDYHDKNSALSCRCVRD